MLYGNKLSLFAFHLANIRLLVGTAIYVRSLTYTTHRVPLYDQTNMTPGSGLLNISFC